MSEVELQMMVPVTVTVDLDRETIESVNVWDEESPALEPGCEPGGPEYALDVLACEIANDPMVEWPAWEFGA